MIDYSEFESRNWSPGSRRSRRTSKLPITEFSENIKELAKNWRILEKIYGDMLRKSLADKG